MNHVYPWYYPPFPTHFSLYLDIPFLFTSLLPNSLDCLHSKAKKYLYIQQISLANWDNRCIVVWIIFNRRSDNLSVSIPILFPLLSHSLDWSTLCDTYTCLSSLSQFSPEHIPFVFLFLSQIRLFNPFFLSFHFEDLTTTTTILHLSAIESI